MQFDKEETKAFTNLIQNRNGQVALDALRKRKQDLVDSWLKNTNAEHGAHMRGKVSELSELIQYLESLSQSKE